MPRIPTILTVLVLGLFVLPARATVVVDLPLPEHSRRASLVVRGTVEEQHSDWEPEHRRIATFTKIRVLETLSGAAQPSSLIVIRQPGGVVGEVGQHVAGTAQFTVGEEVVVLLEPHRQATTEYTLVALAASKYAVKRANGQTKLVRDVSGLTLLKKDASGKLKDEVTKPVTSMPLEEFRTVVRESSKNTTPPARR